MSDQGAWVDYLCQGCNAYCGGLIGPGPAFVVSREVPGDVEPTFAVLCRDCWNKAVEDVLDGDYLEPDPTLTPVPADPPGGAA